MLEYRRARPRWARQIFKADARSVWISLALIYCHAERHADGHSDCDPDTNIMQGLPYADSQANSDGNSRAHVFLLMLAAAEFKEAILCRA